MHSVCRVVAMVCLALPLLAQAPARRFPAGKDAEGNTLVVEERRFGIKAAKLAPDCRPEKCYILIKSRDGKTISEEPVVTLCRQEHPDVDSTIKVSANRISIMRNAGVSGGYMVQHDYQLSPWRALSQDLCHLFHSLKWQAEAWDWRTLRGQVWDAFRSEDEEVLSNVCGHSPKLPSYIIIPALPVSADSLEKQQARLGSCAVRLDASGANGFVTWGRPDRQDPVEVKLLFAGGRTLLAQIIDPKRHTGSARTWVQADHFEIWLGGPLTELVQFAIPLDEGPVEVGYGKPKAMPIVRRWTNRLADGRTAQLLRIELPPRGGEAEGLTVLYSQSQAGTAQKRMIATSKFRRAEQESLGSFGDVSGRNAPARYVDCRLIDGALEIAGTPAPPLVFPDREAAPR
jgi:hypothetical protein